MDANKGKVSYLFFTLSHWPSYDILTTLLTALFAVVWKVKEIKASRVRRDRVRTAFTTWKGVWVFTEDCQHSWCAMWLHYYSYSGRIVVHNIWKIKPHCFWLCDVVLLALFLKIHIYNIMGASILLHFAMCLSFWCLVRCSSERVDFLFQSFSKMQLRSFSSTTS